MIIRSQDKIKLVIFDNIKKIYVKEPYGLTRVMDTATGEFNEEFECVSLSSDASNQNYKEQFGWRNVINKKLAIGSRL